MKLGIGIDVEEISRIESLSPTNDSTLFNQIFTDEELDYCASKAYPDKHLAGRFVAKEAVFKACEDTPMINEIRLGDIEITGGSESSPDVRITTEDMPLIDVSVSISYTSEIAMAMAVVSWKKQNE